MLKYTHFTLGIGLGANLDNPLDTLKGLRYLLTIELNNWSSMITQNYLTKSQIYWSPLFYTDPLKGSSNQSPYLNATLVMVLRVPLMSLSLQLCQAEALLTRLHVLENLFGRQRLEHWGSRTLDIDLLWYGTLHFNSSSIKLPHPYFQRRSFVLGPILTIFPNMIAFQDTVILKKSLEKFLQLSLSKVPKALHNSLIWPNLM